MAKASSPEEEEEIPAGACAFPDLRPMTRAEQLGARSKNSNYKGTERKPEE